jgi:hypothetical protein
MEKLLEADGIEVQTKEEEGKVSIWVEEELHRELIGQHWKSDGHGYRLATYKVAPKFEYPQHCEGIEITEESSDTNETTLKIAVSDSLHATLIGQHWKADGEGNRVAAYKLAGDGPYTEASADGCPKR